MIGKQDILDRSQEWQLLPSVVEKDYVIGWVLAAIAQHGETSTNWVFKGGTCLKKCYFETYRFSEDLDFTLLPGAAYDIATIVETLQEVTTLAQEMSGISFPTDVVSVRPRTDRMGRDTFEGKIGYRGPLDIPTTPRLLFDLTRHEEVLSPPEFRPIFHPYPDSLPEEIAVQAYSLGELLAEKTRALLERTRPRDLYDVVSLEGLSGEVNLDQARELFRRKCSGKGLDMPTADQLLLVVRSSTELRAEWENMLAHQLPQLPPFELHLVRLASVLRWIDAPVAPAMAIAAVPGVGEVVAPASVTYWGVGVPLEAVRFAGLNQLLVEFRYKARTRQVEPYSLRRAPNGNVLLYGWEAGSTHIKAFSVREIVDLRVTTIAFEPRYRVEFSPAGGISAPRMRTSSGLGASVSSGLGRSTPRRIYVIAADRATSSFVTQPGTLHFAPTSRLPDGDAQADGDSLSAWKARKALSRDRTSRCT